MNTPVVDDRSRAHRERHSGWCGRSSGAQSRQSRYLPLKDIKAGHARHRLDRPSRVPSPSPSPIEVIGIMRGQKRAAGHHLTQDGRQGARNQRRRGDVRQPGVLSTEKLVGAVALRFSVFFARCHLRNHSIHSTCSETQRFRQIAPARGPHARRTRQAIAPPPWKSPANCWRQLVCCRLASPLFRSPRMTASSTRRWCFPDSPNSAVSAFPASVSTR